MKPGEQALVDRVTSMAQTYQSLMYRRHGEWYVNMAHYAGFQWCYWDEENQQVVEPPRRNAYDVRLPIPLLTGAIMRVVSQIIRAPRRWVGIPLSSSEAHLQAATGIQRLLNHYWEFGGLQRLCREEILVAACLAETGWLRITWDPRGGEHRKMLVPLDPPSVERTTDAEIPDNVVPLFQEQVNQLPELRYEESVEPIGDLAVRAVSPFDVVCDPYARRPEQMRWWMEQYWKPRDDVQRKYGKRLQAEHASETTTGFSERILAGIKEAAGTLLALGGLAGSGDRQKSLGLEADDVVLERTFWTAPTDRHPEGRKIVVVNNRLMEAVDNPYGCIPAVPYGCFPIPGSPRKVALASLVRSLQLAINRLNSQDIQNVVLHSRMPWLNPKGCRVDKRQLNDEPTAIIDYEIDLRAPGARPVRLDPPQIGVDVIRRIQQLVAYMDRITGNVDVARGENVPGGRSGSMIDALAERADEGALPMQQSFEDFLTDSGRLALRVLKRYAKEKRIARMMGPGGQIMAYEVRALDIERGYDVVIQGSDYLPRSWGARVNLAIRLAESGLVNLTDPEERRHFMREMHLGALAGVWDNGEEQERSWIHEENLLMLLGRPEPVKASDLHQMHLYQQRRFMRSAEYRDALAAMEPARARQTELLFTQHTDEHSNWLRISQGLEPLGEEGVPPPAAGVQGPRAGGDMQLPLSGGAAPEVAAMGA